jgi:adenylosuccinate lyase/3-carboxy-cis,cis-muconate cycloisomerase
MPHKRNPIRCEAVIAGAMTVQAQLPLALRAMVAQDDRDMGAGLVLWRIIPETFILTGGALERLIGVMEGLQVDPARMRENAGASGGLKLSEAVMLRLAEPLGREAAHAAVSRLVDESLTTGRPFGDVLRGDPAVRAVLGEAELEALLDPGAYLGRAPDLVDRALRASTA